MAKFTKLNIGDSVASSGGRVWKKLSAESAVVEDELAGTWYFNEPITINTANPSLWYFNFTTVNTENTQWGGIKELDSGRLWYYSDTLSSYSAYSKNGTWLNQDYRLITITSKLTEVTNGSTLLTWLKSNATKVS